MSLAVIESILESTDMREVMRPFQDITYLLSVFISVFLANVSIETVKSIIGRQTYHKFIFLLSPILYFNILPFIFTQIFCSNIDVIIFQSKTSQDKKDSNLRMIPAAG